MRYIPGTFLAIAIIMFGIGILNPGPLNPQVVEFTEKEENVTWTLNKALEALCPKSPDNITSLECASFSIHVWIEGTGKDIDPGIETDRSSSMGGDQSERLFTRNR